jgi:hypothetical protein
VTVPLPNIAVLHALENPFNDVAAIPIRRQLTHINIYLRGAVLVSLTLTAPDGRTAHLNQKVP